MKTSLIGNSVTVLIDHGKLMLGRWCRGIYSGGVGRAEGAAGDGEDCCGSGREITTRYESQNLNHEVTKTRSGF